MVGGKFLTAERFWAVGDTIGHFWTVPLISGETFGRVKTVWSSRQVLVVTSSNNTFDRVWVVVFSNMVNTYLGMHTYFSYSCKINM